jgi:hypothetical protein
MTVVVVAEVEARAVWLHLQRAACQEEYIVPRGYYRKKER